MTPTIEHHAPAVRYSEEIYLRAISEIESGNNDKAVGKHGERSRYQIKPSTWKQYTGLSAYADKTLAHFVARKHLRVCRAALAGYGTSETPFRVAMAWRLGPDWVTGNRWLEPEFQDYAQRFENLVHDFAR